MPVFICTTTYDWAYCCRRRLIRSEQFVFGNASALVRTSSNEVLFQEIDLHHYAYFYYLPYYQIWKMGKGVLVVLLSLQNRNVVKNRARDPHWVFPPKKDYRERCEFDQLRTSRPQRPTTSWSHHDKMAIKHNQQIPHNRQSHSLWNGVINAHGIQISERIGNDESEFISTR